MGRMERSTLVELAKYIGKNMKTSKVVLKNPERGAL
jgi:hypothetical protein